MDNLFKVRTEIEAKVAQQKIQLERRAKLTRLLKRFGVLGRIARR